MNAKALTGKEGARDSRGMRRLKGGCSKNKGYSYRDIRMFNLREGESSPISTFPFPGARVRSCVCGALKSPLAAASRSKREPIGAGDLTESNGLPSSWQLHSSITTCSLGLYYHLKPPLESASSPSSFSAMVQYTLLSLLSLLAVATATPRHIPPPLHIPLTRRSSHRNASIERFAVHADFLRQKYGYKTTAARAKRAGETVGVNIIDQVRSSAPRLTFPPFIP